MRKNRDVRTLVLCKVNSSPNTNYIPLYRHIQSLQEPQIQQYITLGGFDSMYIYQTPNTQCNNSDWLDSVLADKQKIVSRITAKISYHPIYLVCGSSQSGFWNNIDQRYPYFFVTFLYGVYSSEKEIHNFLQEDVGGQQRDIHAIYRCINISDMVVFTRSDNIRGTLKRLSNLELCGHARQTYTTLNFAMDANGRIASFVYDALNEADESDRDFTFFLQGSIRNRIKWNEFIRDARDNKQIEVFGDNKINFCFGPQDFSVSGTMTNRHLSQLLTYFSEKSQLISAACWEIHTEVGIPSDLEEGKYTEHESILTAEYNRFLKLVEKGNIKEYPWQFSFMELFASQVNIDNHPLLHGPSYLLSDCFRIINEYISYCSDDISETADIIEPKIFLWESQSEIERFIRCCSHLTDQLTRSDDVVFHGLGRIPAISSTLPECALEFYYYFLRNFADILISYDKTKGRKPADYEYSFLLAPELSERMHIRPMFNTKLKYRKDRTRPILWPKKQVYIIQFPTDNIYKPMECFIPLVHECFHKFGDHFRFRVQRFRYMAMVVSEMFLSSLGLTRSYREDLFINVVDILADRAGKSGENCEPFLDEAKDILYNNLKGLLTLEGLERLYKETGKPYYLYAEVNKNRWGIAANNMDNRLESNSKLQPNAFSYITACCHFFRECYADIMTIVCLDITPEEYLYRLKEEYSWFNSSTSKESKQKMNAVCQRNAVVLAAYCREDAGNGEWNQSRIAMCRDAIGHVFQKPINKHIPKTMDLYLQAIVKGDVSISEQLEAEEDIAGILSPGALKYIVEYLYECKKYLSIRSSLFCEFRRDFNDIIRSGGLFGERFYKIVEEGREAVKQRGHKHEVSIRQKSSFKVKRKLPN